jgi:hypothetical protein
MCQIRRIDDGTLDIVTSPTLNSPQRRRQPSPVPHLLRSFSRHAVRLGGIPVVVMSS